MQLTSLPSVSSCSSISCLWILTMRVMYQDTYVCTKTHMCAHNKWRQLSFTLKKIFPILQFEKPKPFLSPYGRVNSIVQIKLHKCRQKAHTSTHKCIICAHYIPFP